MNKVLTVVLIACAALVQCETNTDVIESFAQIYQQLHDDIGAIQSFAHGSAFTISRRLTTSINNAENILTLNQNDARAVVDKENKQKLEEFNLSPDNEKVKKCIIESNNGVEKMILKSQGGFQVCRTSSDEQVDEATLILNRVYDKQAQEHYEVEGTKKICNSTAQNPAQLKNCLSYQLFVKSVESIKHLKEESEQVVKNYESVSVDSETKLSQCASIVKKNLYSEVNVVTLKFRGCCNDIVQAKFN